MREIQIIDNNRFNRRERSTKGEDRKTTRNTSHCGEILAISKFEKRKVRGSLTQDAIFTSVLKEMLLGHLRLVLEDIDLLVKEVSLKFVNGHLLSGKGIKICQP